ncbi:uncharacterized protein BDR25DRAFT_355220 [Lindgomyces ingoldianus]|uniref:Uncharacterized protein n=1 Tax=Lindgomyces ingoldianus TaxID=673940 RepID=A0ACB6QUS1_9PLEO|nr:uncharacterized protein BDR25DRAFT_355220 [Lindgomyces ingoldianus]KAF2470758.1 hypothetical protein BDR25DRAFT_355220 [Lindgomyces ingoldianus]
MLHQACKYHFILQNFISFHRITIMIHKSRIDTISESEIPRKDVRSTEILPWRGLVMLTTRVCATRMSVNLLKRSSTASCLGHAGGYRENGRRPSIPGVISSSWSSNTWCTQLPQRVPAFLAGGFRLFFFAFRNIVHLGKWGGKVGGNGDFGHSVGAQRLGQWEFYLLGLLANLFLLQSITFNFLQLPKLHLHSRF